MKVCRERIWVLSRSSWFKMLASKHLPDPPDKLSKRFLILTELWMLVCILVPM